jgi:serralysin
VGPGDVVNVVDGTYAGFEVRTSGTAANPITFRAQGSSVVVNRENHNTPDNINVEGADYVVIEGFVVVDAPRVGVRAVQATGVVFRDNVISGSGLTGILTGWTPEIEIVGNVCATSRGEHGFYVSNSNVANDNPIIRDNECYGNAKNGIQINGDCWVGGDGIISGALIEGNFVHDNNWKGLSLISMQNSIVRNNVIYDNGVSAGAGGIHLADQVGPRCYLPSSNNIVVNNTVVEPRIACIRMTDGSTNNVVFNNICCGANSSRLIEDEVGGNLIDSASNLTLLATSGLFVNVAGKDFHLSASSNAINAGIAAYQSVNPPGTDRDGRTRPMAGAWDIGAYEYQGAVASTDR